MANTPPVNITPNSQSKLEEISLLRCVAVVSLVMWHTLCIYLSYSWGHIDSPINHIYQKFAAWLIPEANMPLFTFLAGYLMAYQFEGKKYNSLKMFVNKKIHRLLIPYLVLGSIMVILQPGNPDGWIGMVYGSPNHMWYCLMLFYCYMLFYLMQRYTKDWLNTLLAMISLLLNISFESWGGVYRQFHFIGGVEIAAYFYFWFWLGAAVYKHKDVLISKSGAIVATILYVFAHGVVKEMAFIFLLLIVASWIVNAWEMPNVARIVIERFAKCSFGIYVFHHLILWDITHIDAISKYVLPLYVTHYILMPIGMFAVALGLSYFLTELSLRTKVGNYLLS